MNRSKELSATAAGILFTEEVRANDEAISLHATAVGTGGVFTVEISNDNVNWIAVSGVTPGYGGVNQASLTAANTMAVYMVQARFYRVRLAGISAGTATAVVCVGIGWIK